MALIRAAVYRGLSRRRLLAGAAAVVPLAYLSGCATEPAIPTGAAGPFALGVASGEPTPDGVVLWTRLAPDPINDGGMPDAPVEVAWTIARDEAFTQIVQRGTVTARPEDAHAVHVELTGLEPSRWYWYRFVAGGMASPVGRTRTAPVANAPIERLRFAFASCQQYEQGFFAAYRHMAADDLDLVLFLGDYIYETSWGGNHVRRHGTPEIFTLADYRNRYALYKTDPDLQAAHAAFPWATTWDDHEVSNDYASDRGEKLIGPAFLARRAAAYKAYWEHMPVRPALRPSGADLRLYRALDFGDLARITLLDDRQYRDHQPCHRPNLVGGSNFVSDAQCPDRRDPRLTLLGAVQEGWLETTLGGSRGKWNVLAQQTRMAQWDTEINGPGRRFWTDGWDGYPAARRRLLDFIAARKPANPLVIGGDVHGTYVTDLKPDFDGPRSPVVATEICGTSITSQAQAQADTLKRQAKNPHVKFADSATKGYLRVELGRRRATAELRGVADVRRSDSGIATTAGFVVEDGRAGAQRA
ncbi:MAG: alkaline phosphatase D family protein [Proteobacteria bacterium]|nr:alkaline phosphatase D family protein [Pseudomonadota bacterium]